MKRILRNFSFAFALSLLIAASAAAGEMEEKFIKAAEEANTDLVLALIAEGVDVKKSISKIWIFRLQFSEMR